MNALCRLAASAAAVVALAVPASAGQVRLEIKDGLVTLDAKDASVREILAEWARVGRTRIVNGERAPGSLLTLQLSGVPEKKALDIVLRASAGYIAAPRQASETTGSQYDRIVVMAVPRPPADMAGAAPAPGGNRTVDFGARVMPNRGNYSPPQPGVLLDDQDQPVVQPEGGVTGSASQPGMPTTAAQPAPFGQPGGQQPAAPTPGTIVPGGQVRPGMPTAPIKPPGSPGGNEGGMPGDGGQ